MMLHIPSLRPTKATAAVSLSLNRRTSPEMRKAATAVQFFAGRSSEATRTLAISAAASCGNGIPKC